MVKTREGEGEGPQSLLIPLLLCRVYTEIMERASIKPHGGSVIRIFYDFLTHSFWVKKPRAPALPLGHAKIPNQRGGRFAGVPNRTEGFLIRSLNAEKLDGGMDGSATILLV